MMNSDFGKQLACTVEPVKDVESVLTDWQQYSEQVEHGAFLSSYWIRAWLNAVLPSETIYLARVKNHKTGKLLALTFLYLSEYRRRALFQRRVLFLNECAPGSLDMVIEHNGVLTVAEDLESVWACIIGELQEQLRWDELQLRCTGKKHYEALHKMASTLGFHVLDEKQDTDPVAVLVGQPEFDGFVASLLSKNKKRQIKRAESLYNELYGPVTLSRAEDEAECLSWFSEMGVIHTEYWRARGEPGSFSNPDWVSFHQDIIRSGMQDGFVEILKISAGEKVLGYLYNFVWKGSIYNIQSGLAYEKDNRLKPGFLAHFMALKHHHGRGSHRYHFLMGGQAHKKSLSHVEESLYWVTLQEKSFSIFLEGLFLRVVRRARQLFSREVLGDKWSQLVGNK